MIVAVDNNFVVPVPTTMKAGRIFPRRERHRHRAGIATTMSRAVSAIRQRLDRGRGRRRADKVGLMLKAASEQAAIDGALADCAKQDRSCRVIAHRTFRGRAEITPKAVIIVTRRGEVRNSRTTRS